MINAEIIKIASDTSNYGIKKKKIIQARLKVKFVVIKLQ